MVIDESSNRAKRFLFFLLSLLTTMYNLSTVMLYVRSCENQSKSKLDLELCVLRYIKTWNIFQSWNICLLEILSIFKLEKIQIVIRFFEQNEKCDNSPNFSRCDLHRFRYNEEKLFKPKSVTEIFIYFYKVQLINQTIIILFKWNIIEYVNYNKLYIEWFFLLMEHHFERMKSIFNFQYCFLNIITL